MFSSLEPFVYIFCLQDTLVFYVVVIFDSFITNYKLVSQILPK